MGLKSVHSNFSIPANKTGFLKPYAVIIAFHKPYGVLCQFTPDQPGQRTLADFGFPKGIYSLGRLDMDSEGLLLLSDQPGLNSRLLDPENAHPRSYLVQVEGVPDNEDLTKLTNGSIVIQGHQCLPCTAELNFPQPEISPRIPPIRVRKSIPDIWLRITLIEGKNRQVRRMTATIGHPTLRLIRFSIGEYDLDQLEPGRWVVLIPSDVQKIGI